MNEHNGVDRSNPPPERVDDDVVAGDVDVGEPARGSRNRGSMSVPGPTGRPDPLRQVADHGTAAGADLQHRHPGPTPRRSKWARSSVVDGGQARRSDRSLSLRLSSR